jgi:hypothetical protein
MIPGLSGILCGVVGSSSPSIEYQESSINTSNLSTYTFSSKSFGEVANRSLVIVGVTSADSPSSVTIGGVSATQAADSLGAEQAEIHYAVVPTGTTGTVVVNYSSAASNCGIHIWAAYNLSSTTPTDTATDTVDGSNLSTTIDVSALGIVVAVSKKENNTTCTWTGVTERHDQQAEGTHTCGDYTATVAETGRTIIADYLSTATEEGGLAVAAWR